MWWILGPDRWSCWGCPGDGSKCAVKTPQQHRHIYCCFQKSEFLHSSQAVLSVSFPLIEVEQISLDTNISHASAVCHPMFLCANLRKSLFTSTIQYAKPKGWCTCIWNYFRERIWKLPAPLKIIIWRVKPAEFNWKKVLYEFKRDQE